MNKTRVAMDIFAVGFYAVLGIVSDELRPYALIVAVLLAAAGVMRGRRLSVALGLQVIAVPIMVLGLIVGVTSRVDTQPEQTPTAEESAPVPTASAEQSRVLRGPASVARAVHRCEILDQDERERAEVQGDYCAVPVLVAKSMSYDEWKSQTERHDPVSETPIPLARTDGVTLRECLSTGAGGVVSAAQMYRMVSEHDWPGYSAEQIAGLFLEESGGCIAVVSVTNDYGACQVHRAGDRDEWIDFDRVLVDPEYAITVCREIWERRTAAGICAICGWYAGEGVLW